MNLKTSKMVLCIVIAFVLAFSCSCDGKANNATQVPEYRKISAQQAKEMMDSGDPYVLLDVRTQEEFDGGHIKNAILLPDYEIEEKAESIIIGKNQIILVYCRTGVRSEIASKKLIEMGYANVYDFGGIVDWTGEIVWDATDTIFYNYFGGDLPPDIITPIDFMISAKIDEDLPDFTFSVRGENVKKYQLNANKTRYYIGSDMNNISSICITTEDGKCIQELANLNTSIHTFYENFGVSFDDWNFDGYLDISLPNNIGGGNSDPHLYWLWDNSTGKFVKNTELEEMSDYSNVSIDIDNCLVESATGRMGVYETKYYKYENRNYILVKQINIEWVEFSDEEYTEHVVVQELINGKMRITQDYYETKQIIG